MRERRKTNFGSGREKDWCLEDSEAEGNFDVGEERMEGEEEEVREEEEEGEEEEE